jgi:hypothetical protein
MDVAQAVVAGVAAAELELGLARHHIELVVDHQDFIGLDLEESVPAPTDLPDRFMKVCGSSSQTSDPAPWCGPPGRDRSGPVPATP